MITTLQYRCKIIFKQRWTQSLIHSLTIRESIPSRTCDELFGYLFTLQKCWKAYNKFLIQLSTLFAAPEQNLITEELLIFMEPKDSTIFLVLKWRSEVKVLSSICLGAREAKSINSQCGTTAVFTLYSPNLRVTYFQVFQIAKAGSLAKSCTKVITQKITLVFTRLKHTIYYLNLH